MVTSILLCTCMKCVYKVMPCMHTQSLSISSNVPVTDGFLLVQVNVPAILYTLHKKTATMLNTYKCVNMTQHRTQQNMSSLML